MPEDKKDAPEKKGSKKKMIIIAVVLVVVLAAAYVMLGKKKSAAAGPPKPGVVVDEAALTINLAGGHYLQVKPALQLDLGVAPAALATDTPEIVNTILTTLSGRSMDSLSGSHGIRRAGRRLLAAINRQFPGKVYRVLFTQFVMQ